METNPRQEEHLDKNPLLVFSMYTDTQYKIVQSLGQEIIQCLDAAISPDPDGRDMVHCDAHAIDIVYCKFWLWVLGAYEVVRTMCQAKQCFSDRVGSQLKELKQKLAPLRIAFAKQELQGEKVPVGAEPSPCTIAASPPDLKFRVKDQLLSVRELIAEFAAVLGGIKRNDVLADHRTSFSHVGPGPAE